ncbi:MAG: hypothetical protein DKINENOH_03078 [bacterium]|nr:hypothetical protein [bacterium]NUM68647.1 hypothetical protein [candidate division KSB1 bacterium]
MIVSIPPPKPRIGRHRKAQIFLLCFNVSFVILNSQSHQVPPIPVLPMVLPDPQSHLQICPAERGDGHGHRHFLPICVFDMPALLQPIPSDELQVLAGCRPDFFPPSAWSLRHSATRAASHSNHACRCLRLQAAVAMYDDCQPPVLLRAPDRATATSFRCSVVRIRHPNKEIAAATARRMSATLQRESGLDLVAW